MRQGIAGRMETEWMGRERGNERKERDREEERGRERGRGREKEWEEGRKGKRERETDREKEMDSERQTERKRQERQTVRDRQWETDRGRQKAYSIDPSSNGTSTKNSVAFGLFVCCSLHHTIEIQTPTLEFVFPKQLVAQLSTNLSLLYIEKT